MAIPNLPTFVNGQAPPVDAPNLNTIADAVKDAHARLDALAAPANVVALADQDGSGVLYLRNFGGVLQKSTDNATWSAV